MRICHVTTFYPPENYGGDGILVREICEALADAGHEVDVVHCRDAFALKGVPSNDPPAPHPRIRVHTLSSGLGFLSPLWTQQTGRPGPKRRALADILDRDFDVIHYHNISLVGGPGVLSMGRAPVKLLTPHDHWLICPVHVLWKNGRMPCDRPTCLSCTLRSGIPPQAWRATGYLGRCLRHVDRILPPSRFTADRLAAGGIDRPMEVLPSFTRLGGASDGPAPTPDRPTFLYAGRLELSKGVMDLVDTFLERPAYRLLVAGAGSQAEALRTRARGAEHIEFLGRVDHPAMEALYRGATAAISPVWGPEVFTLAVIEAMACGTPVIARRAGGIAESIERAGGGLVYERPEELGGLLDRLVADDGERQRLAREARAGFAAHFSEGRWVERYLSVIESVRGA